jgi:biotin carboxyl carrier protein
VTFEIDINGRTRIVTVERALADKYHVLLDGEPRELDVRRSAVHGLSVLLGELGASRELQVTPSSGPGEMLVTLDGRIVSAVINARQTGRHRADSSTNTDGEQPVSAPMPGRVVRVLVQAGDEVTAKQGVIVVEAMKMENELRSPKAGRIKEINVIPGTSVEAGRVLLVVE